MARFHITLDMEQRSIMDNVDSAEPIAIVFDNWEQKIVGKSQEQIVKYATFQGKAVRPPQVEDELFIVLSGKLVLAVDNCFIVLKPREFILVAKGIEYKAIAFDAVHVMIRTVSSSTGNDCI